MGERFNRAKPQYLIKRKKKKGKRSKNNRTFESKLHPSANTRNNEKEKGKQTTLISVYGLFTQSQHELGVRDILFNGMKIINTKVQKVYFAKKTVRNPSSSTEIYYYTMPKQPWDYLYSSKITTCKAEVNKRVEIKLNLKK